MRPYYNKRLNVSSIKMRMKCAVCARFEGLIVSSCTECGKQFCLSCCLFKLVVDGKFYCDACLPAPSLKEVNMIATFSFIPGQSHQWRHEARCVYCNWLVWFKGEEILQPHSCARVDYAPSQERNAYDVTVYGEGRINWDRTIEEKVVASRVALRLGAENAQKT